MFWAQRKRSLQPFMQEEFLIRMDGHQGMVMIGTGSLGDRGRQFVRLPYSNKFRARLADGTPILALSVSLMAPRLKRTGECDLRMAGGFEA